MKYIIKNRFNLALLIIAYCAYIISFIYFIKIMNLNEQYGILLRSEAASAELHSIRHGLEVASNMQFAGGIIYIAAILWIGWRIGCKLEFKLKIMLKGFGYILLLAFVPVILTSPFVLLHSNFNEIVYLLINTLIWISIMFIYFTVHKYFRLKMEK